MPQRIIASLFFVIALVTNAAAQEATATAQTAQTAADTTTASPSTLIEADSNETRESLQVVLSKYPPQVSKVLKLDPTLFSNQAYLGNYPALATFVAQHPEVAHTPAFYLESIWIPNDVLPESQSVRVWREMMEGVWIFLIVSIMT